jgi:RNA polymerase sigma-70 factor (ECF subfamily)
MEDDEFVADLFTASYRRLVGQLYAMCGDLAGAEDAVQEAFVRAIDHSRTFRRADNPEAWLCRVAINVQRNRWRRMKTFLGLRHRLGDPVTVPEADYRHVMLMEALATLPEPQRVAIVLHHLVDLTVAEIAGLLGVPTGTVKARLSRGRATLAEILDDRTEERHV